MKTMKSILGLACLVWFGSLSAQTQPITWTNSINVTVNGDNSLTKTGGTTGVWDAGIASQNILPGGQNGFVQFVYQPASALYMVSLSRLNNLAEHIYSDYSLFIN